MLSSVKAMVLELRNRLIEEWHSAMKNGGTNGCFLLFRQELEQELGEQAGKIGDEEKELAWQRAMARTCLKGIGIRQNYK